MNVTYLLDISLLVSWVLLILYIIWYLFLTDCDTVLAIAEKFGRPVSDYAGKVVWITGASSGLGKAMAYELASVGAKLILTARREDLLHNVKSECIEKSEGKLSMKDVLVLPFDITQSECHKEKVKQAVDHFGEIDVLINNAGRFQYGELTATEEEVDREVFEVNFFGPLFLTKLVIQQFLKQGKGHILVISSMAGKVGGPFMASYCGSKHALQGYYESLRNELHWKNISVTIVCSSFFNSSILENSMATKKDDIFRSEDNFRGFLSMTTERSAHMALVASINKLFESWTAYQPLLLTMWLAQHTPDLCKYLLVFIYSKSRLEQAQQGKWPEDFPVWRPLFEK